MLSLCGRVPLACPTLCLVSCEAVVYPEYWLIRLRYYASVRMRKRGILLPVCVCVCVCVSVCSSSNCSNGEIQATLTGAMGFS